MLAVSWEVRFLSVGCAVSAAKLKYVLGVVIVIVGNLRRGAEEQSARERKNYLCVYSGAECAALRIRQRKVGRV